MEARLELLNQRVITLSLNLYMINKEDVSEDDLFKYECLETDLEEAKNEYRWLEFMSEEFDSNDYSCERCGAEMVYDI